MVQGQMLYVTETGRMMLEVEIACLQSLGREVKAELASSSVAAGTSLRGKGALEAEAEAIDRQARRLAADLSQAVQLPATDRRAAVGSRVRLRGPLGRHHTVTLVGPVTAKPTVGMVSFESPLGRALLGREVGEVVSLRELGFDWDARILAVEPQAERTR